MEIFKEKMARGNISSKNSVNKIQKEFVDGSPSNFCILWNILRKTIHNTNMLVTYSGHLGEWYTSLGAKTLASKKYFNFSSFSCISTNMLK